MSWSSDFRLQAIRLADEADEAFAHGEDNNSDRLSKRSLIYATLAVSAAIEEAAPPPPPKAWRP